VLLLSVRQERVQTYCTCASPSQTRGGNSTPRAHKSFLRASAFLNCNPTIPTLRAASMFTIQFDKSKMSRTNTLRALTYPRLTCTILDNWQKHASHSYFSSNSKEYLRHHQCTHMLSPCTLWDLPNQKICHHWRTFWPAHSESIKHNDKTVIFAFYGEEKLVYNFNSTSCQ